MLVLDLKGFHVPNTLAYYGEKSFIALVPDRRDSVYSVASRTLKIEINLLVKYSLKIVIKSANILYGPAQ